MLLFICTQAKLFITKGRVFNLLYLNIHMHGDAFANQ